MARVRRPRLRQAGEERREDGDRADEEQHAAVDSDFVEPRQIARQCRQHAETRHRGDDPENPSAAGHQDRLHQELAEQTRGRRAEGKTNARFFRAIQAAHQRQQGDVGARDQQDKANGGEQHPQHRGGFTDGFDAERRQPRPIRDWYPGTCQRDRPPRR